MYEKGRTMVFFKDNILGSGVVESVDKDTFPEKYTVKKINGELVQVTEAEVVKVTNRITFNNIKDLFFPSSE